MKRSIGISSYVWVSPFSTATLSQLAYAKSFGFDVYEIGIEDPDGIDIALVAEEAERVGIQVNICGAYGETRDLGSDDAAIRDSALQYNKTLIDFALATGSPYVAGPMYATTGKTRLATPAEKARQTAHVVENLRVLADYAAARGVNLALEPLNRFETDFMNTVKQGMDLLGKVQRDNVGFLLDTFHMNIEEKSIPAAIRLAGDRIFDFHACANDRGTPGEDPFDWQAIAQALSDVRYEGPAVIESFTTDITEIARAVSLWRPLAESSDTLARNGLAFLRRVFA